MLPILANVGLDATDDEGLPPYLVQTPPARVVCKAGERAVLVCEAGGTPLPTIKWTKNGSPLDLNNPVTYVSLSKSIEDATGALKRDTIVITPQDIGVEGYYRCSAQTSGAQSCLMSRKLFLPELTRCHLNILSLSLL
jgi:hypothetical protein